MARPHKLNTKYTPEQVEVGLTALVYCGGSYTRAGEVTGIPKDTLRHWRLTSHVEKYFQLAAEHAPEVERRIAQKKRDVLDRIEDGISLGVDKTIQELETGNAKDPSASTRNLAVVAGIHTRDLLTLTGRPSIITESRSADELLNRLQGLLGDVDGTAEHIEDAQLVEETEQA